MRPSRWMTAAGVALAFLVALPGAGLADTSVATSNDTSNADARTGNASVNNIASGTDAPARQTASDHGEGTQVGGTVVVTIERAAPVNPSGTSPTQLNIVRPSFGSPRVVLVGDGASSARTLVEELFIGIAASTSIL